LRAIPSINPRTPKAIKPNPANLTMIPYLNGFRARITKNMAIKTNIPNDIFRKYIEFNISGFVSRLMPNAISLILFKGRTIIGIVKQ
jgi:hypothetical protein